MRCLTFEFEDVAIGEEEAESILLELSEQILGAMSGSELFLIIERSYGKFRSCIVIVPRSLFKSKELKLADSIFSSLLRMLRCSATKQEGMPEPPLFVLAMREKTSVKDCKVRDVKGLMRLLERVIDELEEGQGVLITFRVRGSAPEYYVIELGLGTFTRNPLRVREDIRKLAEIYESLLIALISGLSWENKKKVLVKALRHERIIARQLQNVVRGKMLLWLELPEAKKFISRVLLAFFLSSRARVIVPPRLDVIHNSSTEGCIFIGEQLKEGSKAGAFSINLKDIRRHVVIVGSSGAGKTRLAKLMIEQILRKQKSKIWILDFHGEYYDIGLKWGFQFIVPSSTYAPLAFNIFEVHNEKPECYAFFLSTIISEALRFSDQPLTPQMERILSIAIQETVEGPRNTPLHFIKNLWEWSNRLSENVPSAINSFHGIVNRIRSIFTGASADVFWVPSSNFDVEWLLKANTLIDLSLLTRRSVMKRDLVLFVNVLLRCTLATLIQRTPLILTDEPRLILVVEEARYLVPWKRKDSSIEMSVLEDFAVLARKYGLSLITISQSLKTISEDIIDNSGTLFLMSGAFYERMNLPQEITNYLQIMPPREAIVRLTTNPAIIHVRIADYNPGSPNYDEYLAKLIEKGRMLREGYRRFQIPFEKFIARVVEGSVSDEDIDAIVEESIRESDIVAMVKARVSEVIEKALKGLNDESAIRVLNSRRLLREIVSSAIAPDLILEDPDKLANAIVTAVAMELRDRGIEVDTVNLSDLYYNIKRELAFTT